MHKSCKIAPHYLLFNGMNKQTSGGNRHAYPKQLQCSSALYFDCYFNSTLTLQNRNAMRYERYFLAADIGTYIVSSHS